MLKPRSSSVAATAVLALLLSASAATAQISPFRGASRHGEGLNKDDITMLSGAAEQLNEAQSLQTGDTREWSNPKTGNSGAVTAMRIFNNQGLSCHTVRYDLTYKTPRPSRVYTVDWCKTQAGWRIKS
jgi:hypothetical protein